MTNTGIRHAAGKRRWHRAALSALLLFLLLLGGCGPKKLLHCDRCGRELRVPESSQMTEDWIIYCADCEKELGLDTIIEPG